MLLRLLLALLLAAFAVPVAAPAACHDAPVATHAMPMPMPGEGPDGHAAPVHACIGCIPPGDWLSPRIAAPAPLGAAPLTVSTPRRLLGDTPSPDLPPPRAA